MELMIWHVKLGYLQMTVEAADKDEAIREARIEMAHEWPYHYDMIIAKPPSAFVVTCPSS